MKLLIVLALLLLPLTAFSQSRQLSIQGQIDQRVCLRMADSSAYVIAQTKAGQMDAQIVAGLIAARMYLPTDQLRSTLERLAAEVSASDARSAGYVSCMNQFGRVP